MNYIIWLFNLFSVCQILYNFDKRTSFARGLDLRVIRCILRQQMRARYGIFIRTLAWFLLCNANNIARVCVCASVSVSIFCMYYVAYINSVSSNIGMNSILRNWYWCSVWYVRAYSGTFEYACIMYNPVEINELRSWFGATFMSFYSCSSAKILNRSVKKQMFMIFFKIVFSSINFAQIMHL